MELSVFPPKMTASFYLPQHERRVLQSFYFTSSNKQAVDVNVLYLTIQLNATIILSLYVTIHEVPALYNTWHVRGSNPAHSKTLSDCMTEWLESPPCTTDCMVGVRILPMTKLATALLSIHIHFYRARNMDGQFYKISLGKT